MSFITKNTYGAGNTDLTNLMEVVDMQRLSFMSIEVDETNKQIEAGSVINVNGELGYTDVDTAIADTGETWASIGTEVFYVRAVGGATDEFQYSTVAPAYDQAKGGWYNGNERTILKAYKTAGGDFTNTAIYESIPSTNGALNPGALYLGTGAADSEINFADDAKVYWVEVADAIRVNKRFYVDNGHVLRGAKYTNSFIGAAVTSGSIWTETQAFLASIGDKMEVSGAAYVGAKVLTIAYIEEISGTKTRAYGILEDTGQSSIDFDSGDAGTTYNICIAW